MLFVNNRKIRAINSGSQKIQAVYRGSELVWGIYDKNQVVLEQGGSRTSSVYLQMDGYYRITLIGAGGGGSNNYGGAGAGVYFDVNLTRGTYNYTLGAGGAGAGAFVRNNNGYTGTPSTFTGNGINITCNGGEGRYGRRNGGGYGRTGVLSYSVSRANNILNRTTDYADTAFSIVGGDYDYYGSGGQPQPNDEGAGYSGKDGYIKIVKL